MGTLGAGGGGGACDCAYQTQEEEITWGAWTEVAGVAAFPWVPRSCLHCHQQTSDEAARSFQTGSVLPQTIRSLKL